MATVIKYYILWQLQFAILVAFLCECTNVTSVVSGGGGTETVIGKVITTDGSSIDNIEIELLPPDFNPVLSVRPDFTTKTITDDSGNYSFRNIPEGSYTIVATHRVKRTKFIHSDIIITKEYKSSLLDTLKTTGSITVPIPDSLERQNGYLYVPGTSIVTFTNNTSVKAVIMDSLPAHRLPSIRYGIKNTATQRTIRYRVIVTPGKNSFLYSTDWLYAQRISLNTTRTGALTNGIICNFPVLLRLTEKNFNFGETTNNGNDIRFYNSHNINLPYEIERWDTINRVAEIWVKMDTIYPSNDFQSISMYWGNAAAAAQSNSSSVFDTSSGFAAAWHLHEYGGIMSDATVHAIHGAASTPLSVKGVIGNAQYFNGTSSSITTKPEQSGKLEFQSNGTYSVSVWVKAAITDTDSIYHGIVYKSNLEYGLQIRPGNKLEFFTFANKSGWEGTQYPFTDTSWHLITGVRNGITQLLYIDGLFVDSTKVVMTSNLSRTTGTAFEIGHCSDGGLEPDRYFKGIIDEVRVSATSLSADWIRLCYMNQKEKDLLLQWHY